MKRVTIAALKADLDKAAEHINEQTYQINQLHRQLMEERHDQQELRKMISEWLDQKVTDFASRIEQPTIGEWFDLGCAVTDLTFKLYPLRKVNPNAVSYSPRPTDEG